MSSLPIKLIVGLGNPGNEYANTRHNAGFWFIDALIAGKYKVNMNVEGKFFGVVGKLSYQGNDVFLLKPNTFMNLSGKSVLALANFYKILPEQILLVHDELDFMPGVIKLKFAGGSGGHNGLKDTARVIGRDYWRLRIGIGHPGNKNMVHDYVLKKPTLEEKVEIDDAINRGLAICDLLLAGNFAAALKNLHTLIM